MRYIWKGWSETTDRDHIFYQVQDTQNRDNLPIVLWTSGTTRYGIRYFIDLGPTGNSIRIQLTYEEVEETLQTGPDKYVMEWLL